MTIAFNLLTILFATVKQHVIPVYGFIDYFILFYKLVLDLNTAHASVA
jgi:hypothetical protein